MYILIVFGDIFFVSSKRNYSKSIKQFNEFNKGITQNGYHIYEF